MTAYIDSVLVGVYVWHCLGVDCTKTCWSYFNVNFNIVFKTIICTFVGE